MKIVVGLMPVISFTMNVINLFPSDGTCIQSLSFAGTLKLK